MHELRLLQQSRRKTCPLNIIVRLLCAHWIRQSYSYNYIPRTAAVYGLTYHIITKSSVIFAYTCTTFNLKSVYNSKSFLRISVIGYKMFHQWERTCWSSRHLHQNACTTVDMIINKHIPMHRACMTLSERMSVDITLSTAIYNCECFADLATGFLTIYRHVMRVCGH